MPSIGVNHGAGFYRGFDEGDEAVPGHIHDALKTNAPNTTPILLSRHHDDRLRFCLPASHSRFWAADIGFVDFNTPGKTIPTRQNHRPTQLMEPSPRCLVSPKPKNALQAQRADTALLAGDEPHCQKPRPQRLARVLEYGPGRQGCTPIATSTTQQSV